MLLFLIILSISSRALEMFLLSFRGQEGCGADGAGEGWAWHGTDLSSAVLGHPAHLSGFVALTNSNSSSKYFGNCISH